MELRSKSEILHMLQSKSLSIEQAYELLANAQDSMNDLPADQVDATLLYFTEDWQARTLLGAENDHGAEGREAFLVFDVNHQFCEGLETHWRADRQYRLVRPGKKFKQLSATTFVVNPNDAADYQRLFAVLSEQDYTPTCVVHFWSKDFVQFNQQSVEKAMRWGIYSVFYIVKEMLKYRGDSKYTFLYVFQGDKENTHPLHEAVSGFGKTVSLEHPSIVFRTIASMKLSETERIIEIVKQELGETERRHDVVVYQEDERWVKGLKEITITPSAQGQVWQEQGVYIITGGLGGLGYQFAQNIVSSVKAKIVLTGRSELTEKQFQKIKALEACGAEVKYLQSDVSKRKDVKQLILQTKSLFNKVTGIIHSAGVLRDSLLVNKTKKQLEDVMAPKILGTLWLDHFTRNESLDLFVLFSSTAALIGNVGQADYAYSNTFLDSYAKMRAREAVGRTISINWPLWLEGGMNVQQNEILKLQEVTGISPLTSQNGIRAFEAGIGHRLSQFLILEGNASKIRSAMGTKLLMNIEEQNEEKEPYFLQQHGDVDRKEKSQPDLGKSLEEEDYEEKDHLEELKTYVKKVVAKAIRLPMHKLEEDVHLSKYGIDSVIVLELLRVLEEDFKDLPKTLFYEYQTVEEVARYLLGNHDAAVRDKFSQKKVGINKVEGQKDKVFEVESDGAKKQNPTLKAQSKPLTQSRFLSTAANRSLHDDRKDIAIIGISGRFPGASNIQEYWDNLVSGTDHITRVPKARWDHEKYFSKTKGVPGKTNCDWGGFINDADCFDPLFFSISPKEAEMMDPQERIFLENAWHTFEDAGYTLDRFEEKLVGVFVGVMYSHYQLFGGEKDMMAQGLTPGSTLAAIANRVSYYFNLQGPSLTIDTMCSSSLASLHLACESIIRGECEMALAGGVNLTLHPNKYTALSQGGLLSSTGKARSFGQGADGYIPGEGVGAVLLKSVDKAIEDHDQIYAVIKGSAMNHNGRTQGYMSPNPKAQKAVILQALDKARIDPRTITYVEAQATGVEVGDALEMNSLNDVFKERTRDEQFCAVGSVKSSIGHLEAASGIAALIKVILQLKHKVLVPTLLADRPNANVALDRSPFYIQEELGMWKQPEIIEQGLKQLLPRRAAINSFGAGGTNVHVIMEEFEDHNLAIENDQGVENIQPCLIVLSAMTQEQLRTQAKNLADFLSFDRHLIGKLLDMKNAADTEEQNEKQLIVRELIEIVARQLFIAEEDIDQNVRLAEYGLDMFQLAGMKEAISGQYGLECLPSALSLESTIEDLAEEISNKPNRGLLSRATDNKRNNSGNQIHLLDVAYTLQKGRELLPERVAFVVSGLQDSLEQLKLFAENGASQGAFLYSNDRESDAFQERVASSYMEDVLKKRDLEKIARLWLKGEKIDWDQLYTHSIPKRVSLPLYPFKKDRHWLPILENRMNEELDPNLLSLPLDPPYSKQLDDGEMLINRDGLRLELMQLVSETLKIDQANIRSDVSLRKYGMDSLMGLQFIQSLNWKYSYDLSVSVLYDYPTIDSLAVCLDEYSTSVNGDQSTEQEGIECEMDRPSSRNKLPLELRNRFAQFLLEQTRIGLLEQSKAKSFEQFVLHLLELAQDSQGETGYSNVDTKMESGISSELSGNLSIFLLYELSVETITPEQALFVERHVQQGEFISQQ